MPCPRSPTDFLREELLPRICTPWIPTLEWDTDCISTFEHTCGDTRSFSATYWMEDVTTEAVFFAAFFEHREGPT